MLKFAFALLVLAAPQMVFAQSAAPGLDQLMELAATKKVLVLDTAAGKTKLLVAAPSDAPPLVFVFAQGGDGTVRFAEGDDGTPTSPMGRNFAFTLGGRFMQAGAVWAPVAVPEKFGDKVSRAERKEPEHVDAIAKAGQAMKAAYPNAKIILIGHSNGGITAAMQAIQDKPSYDAIVLSAPAVDEFPYGWRPENAKVPLLFITHKNDDCRATSSYKVVRLAADKAPLAVIDAPSKGADSECHRPPAPHFFTGTFDQYTAAILKWAASL